VRRPGLVGVQSLVDGADVQDVLALEQVGEHLVRLAATEVLPIHRALECRRPLARREAEVGVGRGGDRRRSVQDSGVGRGPVDDRPVVVGRDRLVQRLDELALAVEPIVLGGGKTIYSNDGEARPFELVSVATAKTGVLFCRYQRAR
jgi:hypothetical protein